MSETMTDENQVPTRCDPEIFRMGHLVLMTHTIRMRDMEAWVKSVAALSGQPVDWHQAGGRACVKALGDLPRVYAALEELMPEHDRLQTEAALSMHPDWPFAPNYTLYAANEVNTAVELTRGVADATV